MENFLFNCKKNKCIKECCCKNGHVYSNAGYAYHSCLYSYKDECNNIIYEEACVHCMN